jgi:hypothetical protein
MSAALLTTPPSVAGSTLAIPTDPLNGPGPSRSVSRARILSPSARAASFGVFGAQDREFVATPSRAEIGIAQLRSDDVRKTANRLVAGTMAVPVVNRLETIEIQQEQRERFTVAPQPRELSIESIVQATGVREAGQRIRFGQVSQLIRLIPQDEAEQCQRDGSRGPYVQVVRQIAGYFRAALHAVTSWLAAAPASQAAPHTIPSALRPTGVRRHRRTQPDVASICLPASFVAGWRPRRALAQ